MSLDPGGDALSPLLSILNDNNLKPGSSIVSVANATTIDLLRRLLSRDDYVGIAEKMRQDSDVMNLLEFTLHILRHHCLSYQDATMDISQRARRLMLKIVSKTPVVPRSFIVTGVSLPDKRDYIGFGGYGNVFKGEFRGTVVALKELYKNDVNNLAFCREALMWGSLKHNFVLPFTGIHEEDNGTVFLVSPYMKNGTLAQWRKNTNPSIAQITERILEVAQGMEYIHSEGVVHGDLRGENVLLDDDFHVQIADFGLTRLLDATNTRSGAKHLSFAAPELFGCLEDADDSSADDPARTQMSDVYAFGCTYYEIHYDSIPFAGRRDIQIMALVTRGQRPPRQNEPPLSDGAWVSINQCWVTEPPRRPTMKDVAAQITVIYQCVAPPTSARNDGMLQDASLSLSTSSTTPPERDTDAPLSLQPPGREVWWPMVEDPPATMEIARAMKPPPPPPETVQGYNPVMDEPRPTVIEDYLRNYDVLFIIDDSGSMLGSRWDETRDALLEIGEYASKLNVRSASLRFLNCDIYDQGVQGAEEIISRFDGIMPCGWTPTGAVLKEVLDSHFDRIDRAISSSNEYSKIPPLDIIVLTDGVPTDDPAGTIEQAVARLRNSRYHPNTMSIQFVQIGDEPDAKEALTMLVKGDNGSIVDTVPYRGVLTSKELHRIVLGGLHPNVRALVPESWLANDTYVPAG